MLRRLSQAVSILNGKRSGLSSSGDTTSPPTSPTEAPQSSPDVVEVASRGSVTGWPADASSILYHGKQGIIVVGTEAGSVHVFGSNWQSVLHRHKEEQVEEEGKGRNGVRSLLPLESDKVLVCFRDNSLAVLSMDPSLALIARLGGGPFSSSSSWLRTGVEITCVNVDEPSGRSFVYIGTSDGSMVILEFVSSTSSLRVCEYSITWSDAYASGGPGPSRAMELRDVQICPKDERYVALGYSGRVVIYDMSKHKVHRTSDASVTSMQWDHTGVSLYVGTADGRLFTLALDHAASPVLWSSDNERSTFAEDDGAPIAIRELRWLAPQASMAASQGVLLLLLGSDRGTNLDNLRSVIVGLSPTGKGDQLEEVLAIPPLSFEDVVGIRLVPRTVKEVGGTAHPSLLLLTQICGLDDEEKEEEEEKEDGVNGNANNEGSKARRLLRIVQCPSGPTSGWGLEIGSLPVPALVFGDVLPYLSEQQEDTPSFSALAAAGSGSMLGHALTRVQQQQQRDVNSPSAPLPPLSEASSTESGDRKFIFSGASGGVVVWTQCPAPAAAPTPITTPGASLCRWAKKLFLPTTSESAVTLIACDETRGVVAAADSTGCVTLWGVFDSSTKDSTLDKQTVKNITAVAKRSHKPEVGAEEEEEEDEDDEDLDEDEEHFHPDSIQELLAVNLAAGQDPSALLVVGECTCLFVGTASGAVYCVSDWHAKTLQLVLPSSGVEKKLTGSVVGLTYSSFWLHGIIVPAIYVMFSSGAAAVLHLHTKQLLALTAGPSATSRDQEHFGPVAEARASAASFCCVTDSRDAPMPHPHPFDSYFLKHVHFHTLTQPTPNFQHALAGAAGPAPESAPRRFIVAFRRTLHVYDLTAFSLVTKASLVSSSNNNNNISSGKSGSGAAHLAYSPGREEDACQRTFASHRQLLGAALVSTTTGAADDDEQSALCCLDDHGTLTVVSLSSTSTGPGGRSLLPLLSSSRPFATLLPPGASLSSAVVLSSGHIFAASGAAATLFLQALVTSGKRVEEAAADEEHARLRVVRFDQAAVPSETFEFHYPPQELQLLSGREESVAVARDAARKRSGSILGSLTSSGGRVDLDHLFAKTRSAVEKEDLFGAAGTGGGARSRAPTSAQVSRSPKISEDEDEDESLSLPSALAAAGQAKEALAARGVKLNLLNEKSEALHNGAADYAEIMRENRKQLSKQAGRWGL